MADNFLERHYQEYEKRKEDWLRKKKHIPKAKGTPLSRHLSNDK